MVALADDTAACPAKRAEVGDLSAYVLSALNGLTERENVVIRGFYLDAKTHRHLALELGITPERVRQIRIVALQRLRAACRAETHSSLHAFVGGA